MAGQPEVGAPLFSRTGGPWDWACEVAAACCGLVWTPGATPAAADVLGGARFNHEGGRQPYHDREHGVLDSTLLADGLDHGELVRRLRQLNRHLGWDHTTTVTLPLAQLAAPELRGALWSALYAGSHAVLAAGPVKDWDPGAFAGILT
jgi:hypothetical protein